ncbi:unnamed protein product [Microthlaspi erraticum]|uniref:DUF3741 domain-containing protein n=1 Tax=Microthlaspi erraticum TaxID=1685480 RepID=A0A6D2L5Z0_9BRAS|nr:unnamed protein product [Microthlaspi erraticum]
MGREWYNGGRSICSSKSKRKSNEANGCITALYHFFDFHHFYFPSRHHHHQPTIDSSSRNPKGLVAPRNSLELTEKSPLSTNYKENKSLNIHIGGTESKPRAILVATSSDICNLPRTKTPNVVARLMGLDLLPDNLDLNTSSRTRQRLYENVSGTRSLPVSPRVSSARKSDSDIRRLSLQLNIENKHEEFRCWRMKDSKQDEQSQSPRRAVKQIKEKVIPRRVAMDMTNLVENRKAGAGQNKTELRKVRSKSSQKENKISSNPTVVFKQEKIYQQSTKLTLSKDSKEKLRRVNEQTVRPMDGWKKADSESKFSIHQTPKKAIISVSTPSIPNRCDALEKKKCKKITKSNDFLNISVASSLERARKKMKRAKEQERIADATIYSGQRYKHEEKLPQEPTSSNFGDSITVSANFLNARGTEIDFRRLLGTKDLGEEEERVVAEIERHIVDALVLETVKMQAFSNAV